MLSDEEHCEWMVDIDTSVKNVKKSLRALCKTYDISNETLAEDSYIRRNISYCARSKHERKLCARTLLSQPAPISKYLLAEMQDQIFPALQTKVRSETNAFSLAYLLRNVAWIDPLFASRLLRGIDSGDLEDVAGEDIEIYALLWAIRRALREDESSSELEACLKDKLSADAKSRLNRLKWIPKID